MITLKVIKSKDFKVGSDSHTHYTCGYKGRVFGVNTLNFGDEASRIKADKSSLTIDCDVEVIKRNSTDELTVTTRIFLDVVPKVDISLAQF